MVQKLFNEQNAICTCTVNGYSSLLLEILLGVPQGSILGPILFLLYINDLPVCSQLISLLFADDTTLLASSDSIQDLYNFVNVEFQKVVEFFRSNKIALHPNKTKYMIFSNSNYAINFDAQIYCNFNNENVHDFNPNFVFPISRVKCNDEIPAIRFLGVHFDPNLTFKYHISTIQSKLSKALFALRTTKNFLTKQALTSIYYALFHSHLSYAIEIWSCTNNSHLQGLFKMQKAAVHIISNAPYNAHSEPLFKSLEILPLSELAIFFKLKFMQSYYQKTIPAIFHNTWILNSERIIGDNDLQLRNASNFNIPHNRLTSTDCHPLYLFPKLWDNFNEHSITIIRNKLEFGSKLKDHLVSKLSSTVTCNKLFCPSCSFNPRTT